MIASSSHPRRIRVPHVIDVILVSDPEHIKRIESSGDVNRRFLGEEIPRSITEEAKHTLQRFGEAIFPWKYIAARRAQKRIMTHCARRLPQDVHILDVAHNIGEVVQTAARTLKTLKANTGKPVEEILTAHAPTPQVPRIAVRSSTFDGLLASPTRAGETVLIFKIGKAAAKTKDLFFTFGTGRPERACVFMDFFLAFARDVQKALRELPSERNRA